METIKLRPHHILDIITDYGADQKFEPSTMGHAVHSVARIILSAPDINIELIVGADEICKPCKKLHANGLCTDILQFEKPITKLEYNDRLDNNLFKYFGFSPGKIMTMREYCKLIDSLLPGIEKVCTPNGDQELRLKNLKKGLYKLNIRGDYSLKIET